MSGTSGTGIQMNFVISVRLLIAVDYILRHYTPHCFQVVSGFLDKHIILD